MVDSRGLRVIFPKLKLDIVTIIAPSRVNFFDIGKLPIFLRLIALHTTAGEASILRSSKADSPANGVPSKSALF